MLSALFLLLATVGSAQADPLPVGTFRIEQQGNCVTKAAANTTAFLDPCALLNLTQQFSYNPTTQQIVSVADPLTCLTVSATSLTGTIYPVRYDPCVPGGTRAQRFQRTGPTSTGEYAILTPEMWITGQKYFCLQTYNGQFIAGPCGFRFTALDDARPQQRWTLPLV